MSLSTMSALTKASEFTGIEHTRIVDLLTVLAYISIVMWVIVCLSIIVRQGAIIIIRFLRYNRTRQPRLMKSTGKRHEL